jgi:CBS domain-containing protein
MGEYVDIVDRPSAPGGWVFRPCEVKATSEHDEVRNYERNGKMRDMRVKDVMTHLVVTFQPSDSIHEAARRLSQNHISGAPVVTKGKVVGIVTEYDIVRAVAGPAPVDRKPSCLDVLTLDSHGTNGNGEPKGLGVQDIMTRHVIVIPDDGTIWEAATAIERHGVKRLPVVDVQGHLCGIISRADLVRVMGRSDPVIRSEVLDSIATLGPDTVGDVAVKCLKGTVTLSGRVDRKTTHEIALRLAARVPGVLRVRDRLEHEWDDSKMKIPVPAPDRRRWASRP